MASRVKITSTLPQWVSDEEAHSDRIALSAATDIHRIGSMNAPRESGLLIRSGRITRKGLAYYVISFGGGSVRYAKRRHYENKKNPSSLRYLQRAGDSVSRNFKRYFEVTK